MKANGFDEYEYIAEPSACPICARLDGEVFKVSDMEPGKNSASVHPHCHCSTAPHMDRDKMWKEIDSLLKSDDNHMAAINGRNDWSGTKAVEHSKEVKRELEAYAQSNGFKAYAFNKFDGDPKLLKRVISEMSDFAREYGLDTSRITLSFSKRMSDDDFAISTKKNIQFNTKIFRDEKITLKNIDSGDYFASKRVADVGLHELGHHIEEQYRIKGIEVAKEALYNMGVEELDENSLIGFIESNVSEYAGYDYGMNEARRKYDEVISETLVKHQNKPNAFTREVAKLIKNRR